MPKQIVKKGLKNVTNVKIRRITEVVPISNTAPPPSMALARKHKLLVILMETTNAKWPKKYSASRFEEMIFTKSTLSMHEYFRENNYNTYDLSKKVIGPLRVSESIKDHAFTIKKSNRPVVALIEKTVHTAKKRIDYADFDHFDIRNKPGTDGIVNHVMIVYPGESNDTQAFKPIWPHRGSADVDVGRAQVTSYTILNHGAPLGVFVHEFAHNINLPDLYDRDYSSHGINR